MVRAVRKQTADMWSHAAPPKLEVPAHMRFGGAGGGANRTNTMTMPERPMTASTQNARVREVQDELKKERTDKQKLMDQINTKQEV